MEILLSWLVSTLAILVTAYVLPGVHIANILTALITAVALGVINSILKPILLLLTLPINILTLGLLTFVINALLVLLAAHIVPGFVVEGFWWALAFSIVLSIVNSFLGNLSK